MIRIVNFFKNHTFLVNAHTEPKVSMKFETPASLFFPLMNGNINLA